MSSDSGYFSSLPSSQQSQASPSSKESATEMTPSTSDAKKRKADTTDDEIECLGSSNSSERIGQETPKTPKNKKIKLEQDHAKSHDVDFNLKTRGLTFKNPQKALDLAEVKEGLTDKMRWCEWLEGRKSVKEFPEEYLPLLARYVEESDLTLGKLVKTLHKTLLKGMQDDEGPKSKVFTTALLKTTIEEYFKRVNYGLEMEDLNSSDTEAVKKELEQMNKDIPEKLKIWRWRTRSKYCKENERCIVPKDAQDKLTERRAQRNEWKESLVQRFGELEREEQRALLGLVEKEKKKTVLPKEEGSGSEREETPKRKKKMSTETAADGAPAKNGKKKKEEEEIDREERAKREADKKEKEEKKMKAQEKKKIKEEKVAKAEAEKERQSNFFSAFLQKAGPSTAKKLPTVQKEVENSPKKERSDFDKTFKHFFVRDSVILGSFRTLKDTTKEQTVLDGDGDVEMEVVDKPNLTIEDSLRELRSRQRFDYKTRIANSHKVSEVYIKAAEAHAFGEVDDHAVFARQLKDRQLFPLKYLQFHDRRKPGYYGTWTKDIDTIRPRRPLFKDSSVYNYEYDSDDDYDSDAEGEGEELVGPEEEASNASGAEEEEGGSDDDWMVDDDLIEYEPGYEGEELPWNVDDDNDMARFSAENERRREEKREAMEKKRREAKKLKVNLQPVVKGPFLETVLGENGLFDPFRIEFINDAQCGIDPFSFVSTFISPSALPPPQQLVKPEPSTSLPADSSAAPPKIKGSVALAAQLMPTFVAIVSGSDKTKEVLIDQIKDALKHVKGVTKVSIAATLKDSAIKLKKSEGGMWKVNDEVLKMYPPNLTPTSS
ncbi:hypothetical protein BT69DRAFT_1349817 [Atractiella rhizophila]|nr:hypothetical protein BT69DRAFT_1349817 [Atractiella rhizophila]